MHPRREIHELVADTRQFSLFVQALRASLSPLSVRSLTHTFDEQCTCRRWTPRTRRHTTPSQASMDTHTNPCLPLLHDADADTTKNKTQWLGDCTHGTVLFLTWHRPYILALEVSRRFPSHSRTHSLLIHSSNTYNPTQPTSPPSTQSPTPPPGTSPPNLFAYWALHPLPPPEVIEYETLWITTCRGKREEVRNPLFSFVFPECVRERGFRGGTKGGRGLLGGRLVTRLTRSRVWGGEEVRGVCVCAEGCLG